MLGFPRSTWSAYAFAILAVLLAAGLQRLLGPFVGDSSPFGMFLLAVLATARFAGPGPAVAATVAGAVAGDFFTVPAANGVPGMQGPPAGAVVLYLLAAAGIFRFTRRTAGSPWSLMKAGREEAEVEQQLAFLVEASGTLTATLEPAAVLASVLEISRRLLPADAYAVWRFHPATGRWRIEAASGLSDAYRQAVIGILEKTSRMPEDPITAEDVNALPLLAERRESYRLEGIRSLLAVPLRVGGTASGSLTLYYRRPQRFGQGTVRLATAVANLAAAALHSADQFEEQASLRVEAQRQRDTLRVTLSSIGDAVLATDADGRVTFANPVAQALTGWPEEQARGQPLDTVFPIVNEQTLRPVESPVDKVLRDGRVVGLANHTLLVARDGARRPIDDSAAPIRDADGRLSGVVLVFRDVTDRRAAENALLRNEERLRLFVENVPAAVAMLDRDLRYLLASRRWLADFGLEGQDLRGRRHYDVFPELPERWKEVHRRCLAGAVEKSDEDAFTGVDGRTEWVRWEVRPWSDDQGAVGGLLVFSEVITGWKRAQQAVREQAQTLTGILAATVDHVYVVDRDGRYRHASVGAARVIGFEPGDLVGKHWRELGLPAEVMEPFDAERLEVLRSGRPATREVVYRTPAGDDRHFEYSVAPLGGDGQPADAVVVVSRDVTDRKRAEEALREGARTTETLYRIGKVLAGEHDLQQIVQTVTDEGTALTEAMFGAFFYNVLNERGESYTLYTVSGVPREAFAGFPMPRVTDVFEPTFRGQGVVRLDDVTRDPRYGKNAPHRGMPEGHLPVASYLAVPVVGRSGEVLGGLFFGHPRPGVFTERHERLVAGIAAQAAVAIDNARLYGQVRASEARLAAVLDHSPAIVFLKDAEGRYQLVNRRFEEFARSLGIPGPYLGKSDADLLPAGLAEQFRRDDLEVMATGRMKLYQESGEVDGRRLTTLTTKFPLFDDAGRVYAVGGINLDVSDRVRAEEALRRSEEWSLRILESITDAFFALGRDWRFTYVNRQAEVLLGRGREDLLGKDIWEEYDPAAAGAFYDNYRRAMDENVTVSFEAFFRPHARWYEVHAYPSADGLSVYFRDTNERRRLLEELESERARLRAVVENVPAGIVLAEAPSGRMVLINRRVEEITRHTAVPSDNVAAYGDWVAYHPDGRKVEPEEWTLARAIRGEVRTGDEFLYQRGDGTRAWIRLSGAPIRDAAGRVVGGVVVLYDIDAEKRMAEAVREGEERLRLALEAGRMGVWDWNVRTAAIRWSDDLQAIHGLTPGTFGGTFGAFQGLIHPDDRGLVTRAIERALEEGSGFEVEVRNVWPDGSVHWISGKGKVFSDGGRPSRMVGVGMDVTARRRAEQDTRFLADASATLAALVDYGSTLQKVARLAVPEFADWCAVDVLADDGTLRRVAVAHVDPAKVELAHELHRRYPPDPDAPHGLWNILRTGRSELVAEIGDELLAESIKDPEYLRIMRELGLKSYMGVPLSVRGRVLGAITFIAAESGRRYDARDLTVAEDLAHRAAVAVENARLYQEVRLTDRRKDEFLALLAHELRNPLAPIRNALQVLKRAGDNPAAAAQARDMAERQVHALTRMVDDLLDVSRIMRGKIELRRERADLSAILARAVETARPAIDAGGHRLEVVPPGRPAWVDADPVRLAQVVANLLNNAAKYTDPGGRIRLKAGEEAGSAVVRVRDTGIGIAPDKIGSVFDMFVQVDSTGSRAQGGLGIGLTVVRTLVEMHGGSVEAHSDGLGRGSEFVVRLPLAEETTPSANGNGPEDDAPAGSAGRNILVTDDNVDAAESLAMLLRLEGHRVRVAHDGAGALRLAQADPPDVAFLDIGMPAMDGYEVARRFRADAALAGVVLVAVTGWGQQQDRRRTKEAGFDYHLVKPVEPETLLQIIADPRSPAS